MSAWRSWSKYVPGVLVAAGTIFVGRYYFERNNPAPLAEDAAEIVAAVRERQAWWAHTADTPPSLDGKTNFITSALAFRHIYDDGMSAARSLAVAKHGGPGNTQIWWLSPYPDPPAHGDVILDRKPHWVATVSDGFTSWEMQSTLNTFELLESTAASYPDDGQTNWPCLAWAPRYRAPVAEAFGDVSGHTTISPGGWWNSIGNGTTNYKYSCEQWPYVEVVNVFGGDIFGLKGRRFYISEEDDEAIIEITTPAAPSEPRVYVYRTDHMSQRTSGDQEAYFGVMLAPQGVQEVYTTTPLYSYRYGFNWRARLQTSVRTPIPPGVTNYITIGPAYESHPASLRIDPIFTESIYAGDIYGLNVPLPFVRGFADSDRYDAFAVWEAQYLDKTYQFLIHNEDTDGDIPDLEVSPSAIALGGGARQDITIKLKKDALTWPPKTGRALKRVDLDEAWNTLQGLSRTAALMTLDGITCDSRYWHQRGGSPYNYVSAYCDNLYPDPWNCEGINDTGPLYSIEDAWANTSQESLNVTTNLGAAFPSSLFSYSAGAGRRWTYSDVDAMNSFKLSSDESWGIWDARWHELTNIDIPYPPESAFSSGLVERVAYYLICQPRDRENSGSHTYGTWSWSGNITEATQFIAPASLFVPELDGVPSMSTETSITYNYNKMPIRVSLLGAFSHPEKRPKLALNAKPRKPPVDALYLGMADNEDYYDEWTENGLPKHEIQRKVFETVEIDTEINATAILVVTDWKWHHCAPGKSRTKP